MFRTPIGEAFTGDVRLPLGLGGIRDGVQVTGSLEVDGMVLARQEVPRPSPTPRTYGTPDPAPSVTPGPESTCEAFDFPVASVTPPPLGSPSPSE